MLGKVRRAQGDFGIGQPLGGTRRAGDLPLKACAVGTSFYDLQVNRTYAGDGCPLPDRYLAREAQEAARQGEGRSSASDSKPIMRSP